MLDAYKLEQPIIYKTLINSVKNNKYSHAYLFETNGYSKGLDFAISFAKFLLCEEKYTNSKNCDKCNQCKTIDSENFLELKIIEPEGQWIKKEQLIELQESFKKKALVGNKRIYIINHANKLNLSSANSLLKFLEEPQDGIIAILIAENSLQLLDTIVSRCQVLSFRKNIEKKGQSTINCLSNSLFNNNEDKKNFIEDEKNVEKIQKAIEFIEYFENNKEETILYVNKLCNDYFTDRKDFNMLFEILMLYYKDVINIFLERPIEIFIDNFDSLKAVANKNNINTVAKKLKIIIELKDLIKYNINTSLLMDKLIIQLKGCD